jgi:uncharacterized protein (DUF488 family)
VTEFIDVLHVHGIELVVDVRRFPASRRLPQFNREALEDALSEQGIAYCWIESLGGRRSARKDTPNTVWRVAGFRGYADHIESEEFAQGLFELLMLAHGLRTAIMCAEVLWWRCHRRIISDVLISRGMTVLHVSNERDAEPHELAPPARLVRGELSYRA